MGLRCFLVQEGALQLRSMRRVAAADWRPLPLSPEAEEGGGGGGGTPLPLKQKSSPVGSGGVENVQGAVAEAGLANLAPGWLLSKAAAEQGTHECQETPGAGHSGRRVSISSNEIAVWYQVCTSGINCAQHGGLQQALTSSPWAQWGRQGCCCCRQPAGSSCTAVRHDLLTRLEVHQSMAGPGRGRLLLIVSCDCN